MQFCRLIKPGWAKARLANGKPNPKFIREFPGENVLEGCNFTPEFIRQKNEEGYNCYFFPNHPSTDVYSAGTKHLNGKSIDVFNFVYVDMDLKDGVYATKEDFLKTLLEFPIRPTMVVDTGNGVHAYWKIKNLSRDQYVLTQMALLTHFDTDESVYTVLQLMRLPNSLNTKQEDNFKQASVLDISSGTEYEDVGIFPKEIFSLSEEKILKIKNHINRLEGKIEIQLNHEANIDELPDAFIEACLVNDDVFNLFKNPKTYKTGDRSAADMKLANVLYNRGFSKKEALRVIANSQKALEKGAHRAEYAQLTIDKVYVDRTKSKFVSVGEAIEQERILNVGEQVFGPDFMDYKVLEKPWRKKQILGMIAGSGMGKTAVALKIIKDMIENNGNNDDVFVFVTLEMPEAEIYDRWISLVGKSSPLAYRLYVLGNEDEEGNARSIGLQEIHDYCLDLKTATGKNIGALCIDHFRIISSHINVNHKHNFGVFSEQGAGWGDMRNLSENKKADALKILVKLLDTYLIILTQTTKEKGVGDLPIGKDGAYGTSSFENIVDRLITLWQPLMRVQNLTETRFLAWQYTKNRHLGKNDKIKVYDPKLLTYNMDSGELTISTEKEFEVFQQLLPQANAAREAVIKKTGHQYSVQLDLAGIDEALSKLVVVK